MSTERTLYEIEVALSRHDRFSFVRNIIAFNVIGIGKILNIGHECDMLVLSKSGYLTEIEIKRSWVDFLSDFKKRHAHEGNGIIKYFYYCIPECLLQRAYDKLDELKADYTGVITYGEDLRISLHGHRLVADDGSSLYRFTARRSYRRLLLEEQLQLARLGAMRVIGLKEKLISMTVNPLNSAG